MTEKDLDHLYETIYDHGNGKHRGFVRMPADDTEGGQP